ncbi:MAG: stage V sporulation protein AD [Ruminococcaceae bacterium]|nr:stage V sporulation protein AD [Oscillospiraceae bacterium]
MKKAYISTNCGILSAASVVGKLEKQGPLGACFDLHSVDDRFGQKTWEKAEAEMQRLALNTALAKGELSDRDLDAIFAGDLLNQCIGAAYGLKDFQTPYFGLYGACSTVAEGLILASLLVSSGQMEYAAAVASSHYCAAERQYRSPIEYGAQRAPTAQWTVTGAGAFIVGEADHAMAFVKGVIPGTVIEKGVRDSANMGAAMAPAATHTLLRFFEETGTRPSDFDLIATGDLGYEGGDIFCQLMALEGVDIRPVYNDCGMMIYSRDTQDTHAGGSGCGCSATVLASYLLPKLAAGELHRVLLMGTGAMMSPQSIQQGESIPAVAHLICLTSEEEKEWELF